MNPDDLRRADAIEVVVGQGAKPGGGGMLMGQKISDRVAEMRDLPKGVDQRSACRHPDWTGPDDLEIKIEELREITDWRVPIYVKIGATRTYFDVALGLQHEQHDFIKGACLVARGGDARDPACPLTPARISPYSSLRSPTSF
jgi:glutamate synthase domain-containing protein 2